MKNYKNDIPQVFEVENVKIQPLIFEKLNDSFHQYELISKDFAFIQNNETIFLINIENSTIEKLNLQQQNISSVSVTQINKNKLLFFIVNKEYEFIIYTYQNMKMEQIFHHVNVLIFKVASYFPFQSVLFDGNDFIICQFIKDQYLKIKCIKNDNFQVEKIELTKYYLFVYSIETLYCLQLPNGNQVFKILIGQIFRQIIEISFDQILIVNQFDILYVKKGQIKNQIKGEMQFINFKNQSSDKILLQYNNLTKDLRIIKFELKDIQKSYIQLNSFKINETNLKSENSIYSIIYRTNKLIVLDEKLQIIYIEGKQP